jgi:hypothetical protein
VSLLHGVVAHFDSDPPPFTGTAVFGVGSTISIGLSVLAVSKLVTMVSFPLSTRRCLRRTFSTLLPSQLHFSALCWRGALTIGEIKQRDTNSSDYGFYNSAGSFATLGCDATGLVAC